MRPSQKALPTPEVSWASGRAWLNETACSQPPAYGISLCPLAVVVQSVNRCVAVPKLPGGTFPGTDIGSGRARTFWRRHLVVASLLDFEGGRKSSFFGMPVPGAALQVEGSRYGLRLACRGSPAAGAASAKTGPEADRSCAEVGGRLSTIPLLPCTQLLGASVPQGCAP